jgi:hypothetical protein
MSKKEGNELGRARLRHAVEEPDVKAVKTSVTLRVDAELLRQAQETFGRKLGVLFEAALHDAIKIKKEGKKIS